MSCDVSWCDRTPNQHPGGVHQGVLATVFTQDPWQENRTRCVQLVAKGRSTPVLGVTIIDETAQRQLSAVPTWDEWVRLRDIIDAAFRQLGADSYEAQFPGPVQPQPGGALASSLAKIMGER